MAAPAELPPPRGELSRALVAVLVGPCDPHLWPDWPTLADTDPVHDDDQQLTLFCLHELHHRGLRGVDDRWEWHPALLALAARLESRLESALRQATGPIAAVSPAEVPQALFDLCARDDGPNLSKHLSRGADLDQLREFLIVRSLYTLKEADAHTWAIPRIQGRPKAALVEVQADEYGGGLPARMHSTMFARAMRGTGLEAGYGHYLDRVPAPVLASVNTVTMFGLNRRLRGAAVGHLCAFEITSSLAMRGYVRGIRRLGLGDEVAAYFAEHVQADAVHEQICARSLAGPLALAEPELVPDLLFGAAAALWVEARATEHLLGAWDSGRSALLPAVTP
ncbi:iron-containing redox enzyme family protein [Naumannella sp. ID2617S]|nr:iron-containing redox enzyme family protein [Naumannella sp. ID2617S]